MELLKMLKKRRNLNAINELFLMEKFIFVLTNTNQNRVIYGIFRF